ncbi:alkene reductase [Pseudaeromonas sp. ZJS20]|uniref:alkene reductase n=1 Tax=Pseudaeromonas aegiceratis TaxID=3153928 RepID=UPI00390CB494
MSHSDPLFSPLALGPLTLRNRIVMPPMTRSRAAQPGDLATALMASYYGQRASAGLIVSEGTQIGPLAKGYAWTPGIYTQAQVAAWRQVTEAVHAQGGIIFAQLWHVGRVTHPDNIGGAQPVSASALQADGVKVFVDNGSQAPGFVQTALPRALSVAEIAQVVEEYRQAARNALTAGFDGIELHGANGYLINQFLDSGSNRRSDAYGGSLENRLRFLKEVVQAVSDEIGPERVGVRLAPLTTLNGTVDANPEETYTAAARLLGELGVVYLHIAEADWDDAPEMRLAFKQALRQAYPGVLIYAGKYDAQRARAALDAGWADMVGFGRPFIANPDLVARIRAELPWASHDAATLFGGGAKGFTDYPLADGKPA